MIEVIAGADIKSKIVHILSLNPNDITCSLVTYAYNSYASLTNKNFGSSGFIVLGYWAGAPSLYANPNTSLDSVG